MESKPRSIWPKLVLLLGSSVLGLAFLEGALRLVREPIDFLRPVRVPHPALGSVIEPGSGGHDALGFRNPAVPETADIVTLGDSMTYGFAAPMRLSWPSQLADRTGRSVYNMGVGDHGPVEYAWLLEHRALPLEPRTLVVGLYLGNDLHNAFRAAGRSVWAPLRAGIDGPWSDAAKLGQADLPDTRDATLPRRIRVWLRQHSVALRAFETGPVGQWLNAIGDARGEGDDAACHVRIDRPFTTVLKLDLRRGGVDLDSPGVAAGLRVSLVVVERMIEAARRADVEIAFVLIPTKERVLAPVAAPLSAHCRDMLDAFVAHEAEATARLGSLLEAQGVAHTHPLDALTAAARAERIYLRSGDTHPNAVGYGVIAQEVQRMLDADDAPGLSSRVVPDG